jgi:hypothetical protein
MSTQSCDVNCGWVRKGTVCNTARLPYNIKLARVRAIAARFLTPVDDQVQAQGSHSSHTFHAPFICT